jgi:hypothetical protein
MLLLASLTSGCGLISSERFESHKHTPCPPLVQYSKDEQDQAAHELELIPDSWVTQKLVDDYRVLRDQVRACR